MSETCDVLTGAVPVGVVSVGAVPKGAVPEGAVPEGAVPEGAVPKDAVPRRRRRRRWLVFLAIVLVLGGWFGRFAYLRMTVRPTPRPEYWQAQLEALDPPGAGAIAWAEANKILMNCPKLVVPPPTGQGRVGPDGYPLPPTPGTGFVPANPNPPDMHDVLRGPWDESRPVIKAAGQLFASETFKSSREAMRKAVEAGWSDDTVSVVPGAAFGSFARYREWGRCLVAHSRWAREHERDTQAAIDDWLMTLRAARQARRSHCLMAELVGTAMDSQVAQEMGLAVREGVVVPDSVALAKQIDAIRGDAGLDMFFRASRIYEQCYMEYYFVREGGNWIDVSEFALISQAMNSGGSGTPASRLWNVASPLFHDYETACRNTERRWASAANVKDMRAWAVKYNQSKARPPMENILDGAVVGDDYGNNRGVAICLSNATQMEASVTMVGLAEYRHKQGHYPDMLADLTQGYLPRPPVDYADLGVLRYRREGSDYVLYSIGPDGVDDGGRCADENRPTRLDDSLDLVYTKVVRGKEDE